MPFPDLSDRALQQLVSLDGRTAVITGSARGLGAAIASRLAEAGASVLVADIDEVAARATARHLTEAFGVTAIPRVLDVADPASIAALADHASEALGRLDIWVNNAGIYPSIPFLQTTDEQWDQVIDVNLRGTFIGCREAARCMTSGGRGGVIVNLSSVAGLSGRGPGVAHYVASKHGIVGLTKQLALELADQAIRVLSVAPSVIRTPGVEEAMIDRAAAAGMDLEEMLSGVAGRAGRPDDVARVVLFCVSDLAMFMTGSTLVVDGGEMSR